jgi:hypothetical protein
MAGKHLQDSILILPVHHCSKNGLFDGYKTTQLSLFLIIALLPINHTLSLQPFYAHTQSDIHTV